jgi:FemAB-related protein (PEP-CTERM system-associated)
MNVVVCQNSESRWDEHVSVHPAGTFFHQWEWRAIISNSFGYEPLYICVEEENGDVMGVLPLFLVRSALFGRSLVALPAAVYGGILASSDAAENILLEKAIELGKHYGARYIELRGNPYAKPGVAATLSVGASKEENDLYVTFMAEIDPCDDVNLSRIPRKQRRMVKQGEKYALRFVLDNSRLREFYEIYAASVRNLGTPVYGYQYFEKIRQSFPETCKIFLVEYQGKVIAGVLVFFHKGQVLPYYGGALKAYFHLAPNDFMYWELMRFAAANGYQIFDFGRSKQGTGSFNFKRHWGFQPRPLPYVYYPLTSQPIPDTSSLNPNLQWAIRLWRSLPLKLTMILGPRIIRHIP